MLYKITEYFGPNDPRWGEFTAKHWIQPLLSFDSIDAIMCSDVFTPTTAEDWSHCVNQDFKICMITVQASVSLINGRHR